MFHEERRADQVGRYALLTRLATGGMAEVFVARVQGHGGFSRLVALKRMLSTLAEEPRFAEMFLDEGRLSGLIDSPHVVQVHDVGQDENGALFIAMELVRGVALHQLLSLVQKGDERMPVGIAVAILAQASEGLAAAHAATTPLGEPLGIVHRDISPQNVLVGVDGRARVADFGIARALHRRSSTSTGELKGKLGYFAPEQLAGQPATVQSDVFAMGVVAWETLARRRLFAGETPVATIDMIRRLEPRPLDLVRSDIPSSLARAVARALAKDPTERTASAAELGAALRSASKPESDAAVGAFVKRWCAAELDALDQRIRAAISERDERTSIDRVLPEAIQDEAAPVSAAPVDDDAIAPTSVTATTPVLPSLPAPPSASASAIATVAVDPRATGAAPSRWMAAAALVALVAGVSVGAWRLRPADIEVHAIALPKPSATRAERAADEPVNVGSEPTRPPEAPPPLVEAEDPPEAPEALPDTSTVVASPERPRRRGSADGPAPERAPGGEPRRGLVRVDGFLRELENE